MKPGNVEGATRTLGAPADWNRERDGECGALEIRDADFEGVPVMQSVWILSAEEKAAIAAGGDVVLTVWGRAHPPVSIDVTVAP